MEKLFTLSIPSNDGSGTVTVEAPPGIPQGIALGDIISLFVQGALTFGIIVSIVYLTYGGFFWIQSKGDKETLDKARRIITYSIVGLIVMSFSLVIVYLVSGAIGFSTLIQPQETP